MMIAIRVIAITRYISPVVSTVISHMIVGSDESGVGVSRTFSYIATFTADDVTTQSAVAAMACGTSRPEVITAVELRTGACVTIAGVATRAAACSAHEYVSATTHARCKLHGCMSDSNRVSGSSDGV